MYIKICDLPEKSPTEATAKPLHFLLARAAQSAQDRAQQVEHQASHEALVENVARHDRLADQKIQGDVRD